MHPQNLLPAWAGELSSLERARLWDRFSLSWRERERLERESQNQPATPAARAPSLEMWVKRHAAGLSPGQRPFERAGQLRGAEIARGHHYTYSELPWCAKNYLTAAALGEGYWHNKPEDCPYKSPLHAICVLSSQAAVGSRARRKTAHLVAKCAQLSAALEQQGAETAHLKQVCYYPNPNPNPNPNCHPNSSNPNLEPDCVAPTPTRCMRALTLTQVGARVQQHHGPSLVAAARQAATRHAAAC